MSWLLPATLAWPLLSPCLEASWRSQHWQVLWPSHTPPIPAAASFSLASTVPSSTGLSLLCALRDEGSSPAFSEVGGDGWSFLECTCHKHWQRGCFQTFIWRLLPWLIVGLSEMEGGFVREEDMRVLRCYVMMSELFCKETEADRRATWVLGFPNTLPPLFNK